MSVQYRLMPLQIDQKASVRSDNISFVSDEMEVDAARDGRDGHDMTIEIQKGCKFNKCVQPQHFSLTRSFCNGTSWEIK